ncbi:ATP-binding cassette domain-containing protein, partial [Phytoactinopolyspora endophytica]|uniref:ATP-binding cassette domain-containing protein n=1 Tax=Phytoactinopolyspora endophytica TaxID=1642495 RepID=UPI001F104688
MTLLDDDRSRASVAGSPAARLHVDAATIGYDKRVISEDLSVSIPDESFTVIVGPNACGKSTLLRAMSRLLTP